MKKWETKYTQERDKRRGEVKKQEETKKQEVKKNVKNI